MTKENLLRLVITIAKKAGVRMGIGGGIAVNSYGYQRETADVDAFFHYTDQSKILRTINKLLGDLTLEELDTSHWILVAPDAEPNERIDLLFASGDPEESAIEMTVEKSYRGVKAPMFPIDMLVISKFLADRDDAKDSLDIYELRRRGAYDVEQIMHRLRQMGMPEDAARFYNFLSYLDKLSKKKQGK